MHSWFWARCLERAKALIHAMREFMHGLDPRIVFDDKRVT